jgi:Flp pilus assembly protein TadG
MNLPYYSRNILTISKCESTFPVFSENTRKKQRGIVMPIAAISLLFLVGFAALAIDVGYLFVVRNELQNAADSAALAGAGHLTPYTGAPLTPNWANANTEVTSAISLNKAVNAILVNGQVETGYWDITGNTPGVHSSSTSPDDLPAVKVTIHKENGSNGGAVNAFFAQVLGINSFNVGAIGVAVVSSPGYTTKSLIPVAIPSCLYSSAYWDPIAKAPTTPPTTFSLSSTIHYSGCGVRL